MTRRKPRKPTAPYGYVSFAPDGKVEKRIFKLSEEKEAQEEGVIQSFCSYFPSDVNELEISGYRKLPEADHDFVLETSEGEITAQLTEIVQREYAFPITQEEYDSGKHSSYIASGDGEIPLAVATTKRDLALVRTILKKAEKHYAKAKDEVLWLVVFTTCPDILTVYAEGGKTRTSSGYEIAANTVASDGITIFDNIWFHNFVTRPVRVWPREHAGLFKF